MIDRQIFVAEPFDGEDANLRRAPAGLWLFGEKGISQITIDSQTSAETQEEIRRLFPEAEITVAIWIPDGGTVF